MLIYLHDLFDRRRRIEALQRQLEQFEADRSSLREFSRIGAQRLRNEIADEQRRLEAERDRVRECVIRKFAPA